MGSKITIGKELLICFKKIRKGIISGEKKKKATLETFQLKVLGKILRKDTTYINRENSNSVVFERANQKLREEGKPKQITTYVGFYNKLKRKRACKIIARPDTPIHKITFDGSRLRKWIYPRRRVGRPRTNWTEETVKEIWDHLKKDKER